MSKKTTKRKHIPQRTCVGCREVLAKRALVRIVRSPQGVVVDLTGKMAGRGAYLHDQYSCWENGLKGALSRALKIELKTDERNRLLDFASKLPRSETVPEEMPVQEREDV